MAIRRNYMRYIDYNDLDKKYDEIVRECKNSQTPYLLVNNGRCDLVVMHSSFFEKHQEELIAQQLVLESYAIRLAGAKDYSLKESMEMIDKLIKD